MLTSIFLAKAFGIYFVIMALALLNNRKAYAGMVATGPNTVDLFTWGTVALILGIILVLTHNVWVYKWQVVITILAWLTFVKGAMLLVFPDCYGKYAARIFNEKTIYAYVVFMLAIGGFLLYQGFGPF